MSFICTLFSFTSHNLVDNIYTIDETEQAIAGVFTHKYVYSNTYDGKMLCFIYWRIDFFLQMELKLRLQLWQDGLHSVVMKIKLFLDLDISPGSNIQ